MSAASHSSAFKQASCHPISLSHLQAIHNKLNFGISKSYTIWVAALCMFWSCQWLRELLPLLQNNFDLSHHVSSNCNICLSNTHLHYALTFHIFWSKTTHSASIDCSLVERDNIFCPIKALTNHLLINKIPDNYPLFAFYNNLSHIVFLTKDNFLSVTNSTVFSFFPFTFLYFIRNTFIWKYGPDTWP